MLKEAGKTGVKEMKIVKRVLKPYIPAYQEALQQLPELIKVRFCEYRSNITFTYPDIIIHSTVVPIFHFTPTYLAKCVGMNSEICLALWFVCLGK